MVGELKLEKLEAKSKEQTKNFKTEKPINLSTDRVMPRYHLLSDRSTNLPKISS